MPQTKPDKGTVVTNPDECKGCGLCVEACTPRVLRLDDHLNRYGYHPALYIGHGCTACGLCFYVCPEPGGIKVYRRRVVPAPQPAVRLDEPVPA